MISYMSNNSFFEISSIWINKILIAILQFVSIVVVFQLLGEAKYAIFATISSLTTWFLLFDLGLGQTFQNEISKSISNNKNLSKILMSLNVFILIISFIFFLLSFTIGINILTLVIPSVNQVNQIFMRFFILFQILNTILFIYFRLLYSLNNAFLANNIQSFGLLLAIILLIITSLFLKDKTYVLEICLLAYFLPILISNLMCYFAFQNRIKSLGFQLENNSLSEVRHFYTKILQITFSFFGTNLFAAFVLAIDYITISNTLSKTDLVKYNILNRYFTFIFILFSSILQIYWSKFTSYWVTNNHKLLSKTIHNLIILGFIIIAFGAVVFVLITPLIYGYFGVQYKPEIQLFVIFIIYFLIRIWTDVFAVALQSISSLTIFLLFVPIQGIINLFLQQKLSRDIGLSGIIISLIISFLCTTFWALPVQFKRLTKGLV